MNTGFIYIIRNTENDKVYVGQTFSSLERRLRKLKSRAKSRVSEKVFS